LVHSNVKSDSKRKINLQTTNFSNDTNHYCDVIRDIRLIRS